MLEHSKLLENAELASFETTIHEVLDIVQLDKSPGAKFVSDLTGVLDIQARFDKRRLQRVMLNMATNALKFTKKGVIRFEAKIVKARDEQGVKHLIQISVTDQGIGISEEDLPHIFTPFYRSKDENSQRMNSRGHGLGLYICK